MEKVLWNSINKKQNGLKQSKNDKSSILPCNAQLVWLKLIKVYYKFTILCTLQLVINIWYNVITCIL